MLSKTYFKIIGDFNTCEIVELLQINPNCSWNKGDISKKNDRLKHESSMVQVGFVCRENEIRIDRQMLETISVLQTKLDKLKEIKEKFNVEFILQVVCEFTSSDIKPIISPPREIIEFCYLTQTNIDYDYYI